MKLAKILEQILKETGEGTAEAYPFHRDNESRYPNEIWVRYEFVTDPGSDEQEGSEYLVYITKRLIKGSEQENAREYGVSFGVVEKGAIDYESETNQGAIYRIMATVIKIIKEEVLRDKKDGLTITRLRISPSKAAMGDRRRSRIYTAYLKRLLPQATISSNQDGGEEFIVADIPNGL